MLKTRPNRTVEEKIRDAMARLSHHRSRIGTYELQRIIEQAALESAVDEARTLVELKNIVRYMIRNPR